MNAQDEQELRELQADLLAAERSPWQPRCVARAFRAQAAREPFVLTMQAWIDLDAVQSPFLLGRLPEADEVFIRFEEAFAAFGHHGTTPEECDGDELVALGRKMIDAIVEAFSMRVRLEPPEGFLAKSVNNGMGEWLPIVTCLVGQLGFTVPAARMIPVSEAFALIASHRCNQGWTVASDSYSQRDVTDDGGEGSRGRGTATDSEVTHG
jgi:hypothetical protein